MEPAHRTHEEANRLVADADLDKMYEIVPTRSAGVGPPGFDRVFVMIRAQEGEKTIGEFDLTYGTWSEKDMMDIGRKIARTHLKQQTLKKL